MPEIKEGRHSHGDPNGGSAHQGHRLYWTRAHRDWRVWVGVVLMLACMMIYLMSDDLRGWYRGQPQQSISSAIGK
jgi:hypothetical protein